MNYGIKVCDRARRRSFAMNHMERVVPCRRYTATPLQQQLIDSRRLQFEPIILLIPTLVFLRTSSPHPKLKGIWRIILWCNLGIHYSIRTSTITNYGRWLTANPGGCAVL